MRYTANARLPENNKDAGLHDRSSSSWATASKTRLANSPAAWGTLLEAPTELDPRVPTAGLPSVHQTRGLRSTLVNIQLVLIYNGRLATLLTLRHCPTRDTELTFNPYSHTICLFYRVHRPSISLRRRLPLPANVASVQYGGKI
ncbi:hypothetical protein E4T56_gene19185 [Termitomyces sp. T112]|nr:hypothetical protein E4T56_gene19185 [Termitomyces sp. T112]